VLGTVIERIGNCRILSEIASGGMAVVYKAVQESLNRTVAVKALKTAVAVDAQFTIRFEREALSLAQLQHENIIHVYDFYKERGALFIVMEYVEGVDLYDVLERCGRLPLDVAAIIAMQVARALDYAHYRGVIHRDIKPANIMIARSGGVKLMDFGIARDQSFSDLTQTGTGLGTPSYMSPEQILGDRVDFRSDVFSLGIVLYQMTTGRKPFIEDEHKSVMHKIRLEQAPSPRKLNPEIPRELDRIMTRCMQKAPRDRWRSTQDLVLALERFLARRVEMNYHARLVQFLKNTGVVTPEEAAEYLKEISPQEPNKATRQLVRRVAAVNGSIVGAVALTALLIEVAPVGIPPVEARRAAAMPTMVAPAPRPRVQLVAHPWAEIWVDGKLVDITPTATPIDVEAGPHIIVLRNPYFAELKKEVTVPPGEASEPLIFALTGRKFPPSAPDPTHDADPRIPLIVHTVRKGDTLDLLSAEYYGRRDLAALIMLANGMTRARSLKPRERLAIPTAWKVKIAEGDTLSGLAKQYLGDERRASFLAELNHIPLGATLTIGDEIAIPYPAAYTATGKEDLSSLASRYYGERDKAEMLRRYNFRGGSRSLGKGEMLIVPVTVMRARAPEDPEAERRSRKQRDTMAKAREALPAAEEAWRVGDYALVRSLLVPIDRELLDAELGSHAAFLLGSAYIALGDRDSAQRELAALRERRPDFLVRADETSPKIADAWKKVGGRVEDPR
jgi:serine/threonine-protein kinase